MAIPDRRAAYEDLLRRYVTPLRRLASSYERDPPACEDLFQEIALALWTALPGFRGDSSERTWLYRVAHNTAITFATRQRRARSREQSSDEVPEPARGATQERDVLDQQRRARLWAAIHELPLGDRQLIVLHLEGLSSQEIEMVTGITSGAVATRLTRLRHKLAARLRDAAARTLELPR